MRSLCLLLGKEPLPNGINYLKLTCPTDPRRLDAYTMNHFANSNEVREYFQEQIEDYLNKNKSILEEINNRTGIMMVIETKIKSILIALFFNIF